MNRLATALLLTLLTLVAHAENNFTLLSERHYKNTVEQSRYKIQSILTSLKPYRSSSLDTQIAVITQSLVDIPYMRHEAMGEGDWQPSSTTYQPGATHIIQTPVYRLDGLNCQTLVQITMALLHARTQDQFDSTLLKIAYGAAGNPDGNIVRYYNRNHFTDADFNPVNQYNGYLKDVTAQGELNDVAKYIHATIARQNWFDYQQDNLAETVRVLAAKNGPAMVNRFKTTYANLPFRHFDSEKISLSYIPKQKLVLLQGNGSYTPNQALLDNIPTPAVAEIVRDPKKWRDNDGHLVKDVIGTELTVSHLGLLHRQQFNYGDLIYRKTTCLRNHSHEKVCRVTPVICTKKQCNELMFTHATDALPMGYYWYQRSDGTYTCSAKKPSAGTRYTACNRVVQTTLYDYLTDYQLGGYWNMYLPSILGVHIEHLV